MNVDDIAPFYYLSNEGIHEARNKLIMCYETSKLYNMEKCDKKYLFRLFDEYGTDFELDLYEQYEKYRQAQQIFIRLVRDEDTNINNYIPTGRVYEKDRYKKYRDYYLNYERETYPHHRDKKRETMKKYYERMKENKVLCECGVEIIKFSKNMHVKTKKHLEAIKNKDGLSMD